MLIEEAFHVISRQANHLRIRRARLRAMLAIKFFPGPLPIDQRKIFRVRGAVSVWRQNLAESMSTEKSQPAESVALLPQPLEPLMLLRDTQLAFHRPLVERPPQRAARPQIAPQIPGVLRHIHSVEPQGAALGNHLAGFPRPQPANPERLFQETIHRQLSSNPPMPGQRQ